MTVHQKTQLVNQLAAPFVSTTEKINKRQILSVGILLLLVLGSMLTAADVYSYHFDNSEINILTIKSTE